MIKIILADDHDILREGLRALIEKETGMQVIAEAQNGRMTVELCKKMHPDVVIMDITMPALNGIDATRQIREEYPEVKVIALSIHSTRQMVREMLKAGANGYLLKNSAFTELSQAIRAVMAGQGYLSASITGIVLEDYTGQSAVNAQSNNALTAREREVLQLLTEGRTSREIGEMLHLSQRTVETHRRQIMLKLKINNLAGLIRYAIREGLTSVDA